jgi:hypothetical protein
MVSMRDVGASPLARLDDMRSAPASQSSGSQVPAAQMQPLNAEPEGAVSRISLLVLYEPSIPQIGQLVDYLVNYTNEVYSQSQINLEFNVVGTEEYSLPVISDGQALDDITFNETVDAWRDQYSADMVTFLRPYNRADGDCGIAWIIGANGSSFSSFSLQNYTTSVVNVGEDGSFFCDDLTLAHELGHNLGAAHDRGNSGSLAPYYPYGYGFGVSGVFGTVMSYQSPSVGYFSNPSLATCNGELCGEADSSDVARAINNVRQLYADIYDNPDLSLPPDPPDIDSFTATLSSISLNFSPNGEGSGAITGYTGSCGAFTATGDQTALTLQGLTPGTLYSCTVAAENEFGMGAASAPVDAATLPLPPVIVAVEPEDGGLLVRLQPDNASGDAPAAAYRVTCGEITVSSTYSAVVVTGLQNGESYSCSGAIENAAGWSEISLQVSGVPLEAVPTGLSMPLLKAMIDSRQ